MQEGLDDGARLPSLDVEKLREENVTLKEEQQKLKKVNVVVIRVLNATIYYFSLTTVVGYTALSKVRAKDDGTTCLRVLWDISEY